MSAPWKFHGLSQRQAERAAQSSEILKDMEGGTLWQIRNSLRRRPGQDQSKFAALVPVRFVVLFVSNFHFPPRGVARTVGFRLLPSREVVFLDFPIQRHAADPQGPRSLGNVSSIFPQRRDNGFFLSLLLEHL